MNRVLSKSRIFPMPYVVPTKTFPIPRLPHIGALNIGTPNMRTHKNPFGFFPSMVFPLKNILQHRYYSHRHSKTPFIDKTPVENCTQNINILPKEPRECCPTYDQIGYCGRPEPPICKEADKRTKEELKRDFFIFFIFIILAPVFFGIFVMMT